MPEDEANAARAGFDGYVQKPISVRDLVGQVRTFLRVGRP
jgi:DNA-binding response OmpR family regulator